MESPEDRRCKRSDGAKWRCGETASFGRSYCEKHFAQIEKNQMKRRVQREKKESEINVTKSKKKRNRGSDGTESEASEPELDRIPVSQLGGKCTSGKRSKKCTTLKEEKFTEKVLTPMSVYIYIYIFKSY